MNRKKQKNIFLLSTLYFLLSAFLIGCAAVSTREGLPRYNINGITYVPLNGLCKQANIAFDYDTLTKTAILSKDSHRINLMAGESLVLIDGQSENLKQEIEFYQGTVVVPYKFKEQVLEKIITNSGTVVKPFVNLACIKKVVIDAGHGGYDPGAIGRSGLREKNINLDVALRVSRLLQDERIDVVLTRFSDKFISLEQRVDIANKSKAALFVSIHTNANPAKSLNGFEVYYVSADVSDSNRAVIAAKTAVLDLDKAYYDNLTFNLKAILWDMIYTYSRAEAIGLAQLICGAVNQNINTMILGVKPAGFHVLKGARMPAVLVEIGFLSNNNEERLLKNTYYRQQIAQAIAQGIINYGKEKLHFVEAQR